MATDSINQEEMTLYEKVSTYLQRNKDAEMEDLVKKFPEAKYNTLWKYKKTYFERLVEASKNGDFNKNSLKLTIPNKISFPLFTKTYSYPPYYGLFQWQGEAYEVIWENEISKLVVPRDSGKSILLGDICQDSMQYRGYDVLYLGWTDRRKDVAENVYNFFIIWDLIEPATAKTSSPYHFKIKNGGRFDTYLITSKETLGKHALGIQDRFERLTEEDKAELGIEFTEAIKRKYLEEKDKERKLLIIIDDPIDETFREERWKELKLEMKFNSTIANINPDKLIISGTRKFQEDFFNFIDLKYQGKMGEYVRRTHLCTPNIEDLDIFNFINFDNINEEDPRYEELLELLVMKAESHPCYNPNIAKAEPRYKPKAPPSENLLCPERWSEEKLREKRREIGEYWWFAEYEGDPHPITGAVWEKVSYESGWKHWKDYNLVCISIDRATTTNKESSWTGITISLRDYNNDKLVIKDLSGAYDFEDCLELIEDQYQWAKRVFLRTKIIIVVERQGGGSDFITSANKRKYKFAGAINPEEGVHQTRDKIERIKDYLRVPINTGQVKFLDTLRNSELMKEILEFPYPAKLDAIDSLATGIKEMERFPYKKRSELLQQATHSMAMRLQVRKAKQSPIYNNPIQNKNYYKGRYDGRRKRKFAY